MRVSTLCYLVILLVCMSQAGFTAPQPGLTYANCNDTNGNYTTNSTYNRNLKTLFSKISNSQITNGFYKLSVGQDPDRVYGVAICRADYSPFTCRSYLLDATLTLPASCPEQKEAIGFYYGAFILRYSSQDIFRFGENSPYCIVIGPLNIQGTDLRKAKQSLGNLLERLQRSTSAGNSSYKFSSGVEQVTDDLKYYGVAQCNPDLSTVECSNCLQQVSSSLQQCCSNRTGAGLDGPYCLLHFGNYPQLNAVSNGSLQPSLPAAANHTGDSRVKSGKGDFKLVDSLELDFSSIQIATRNFSDDNRLSSNSNTATPMYKGVLADGQEIAVKKLNKGGREGRKEVENEVLLSATFQHKNLVKFLGSCVEKDIWILVYEFLPNGSLHDFLCDPVKRASLDWPTRYHIISGFARGLLYLHEDSQVRVIHRDLKPSNILLDVQMDPKISNFRTASLVRADQTKADSRVAGTYGYMPVEYVQHGHSSTKSDIFSFGVILLEIISGYIISRFSDGENEENLLTYAWRNWNDGSVLDVVDQTLSDIERHVNQIQRCIKIALLCVEEDPRHRPSMSTVVFMLNSDTVDITEPIRPAPLILNDTGLQSDSHTTQSYSSHETSLNEASITTLDPR
ncbi:cysteine-rich receptor-like protein kinase 7 isoform X2 [Silene latifolia]|uniref:cysteine-rich receptor-like protein kinase 7 isoform X2 n=1 Tax=Silene latifolia TaxID=37657 RepID=UPI003D77EB3D